MYLAGSAEDAVWLSYGVGFLDGGWVSGCLDPLEDVDWADAEAYPVGDADVEVHRHLCAVDSELCRGLDLPARRMLEVGAFLL